MLVLRLMILFFLPAPIPLDESAPLAVLESRIREAVSGQKAIYGVAFANHATGERLLINENDVMHAASTMKVPVMMRLFEMADQGELDLDRAIPVRNAFKSIVDGSIYRIEVDSDEDLYRDLGRSAAIRRMIALMIVRSSNLATNLLIELAEPDEIMALMKRLKIEGVAVRRGVEDLKAFEKNLNNECGAGAMLKIMEACAASAVFSEKSRAEMLSLLRRQEFNDVIPAGLPENSGARVAHKTGAISRAQHDAAVIDLPDGTRYFLVIFARDFGDERERVKATGRAISRLIYEYVVR